MLKNYLKSAYRNLLRHKGASLIKLAGLSIGMCCCLLILVYVTDELSYNKFNAHYRDIYRVDFVKTGDQAGRSAGTAAAVGPAIAKDISGVLAVARIYSRTGILETTGRAGPAFARASASEVKRFEEQNVFFADNALSQIFTMRWREGTAADALDAAEFDRADDGDGA